MMCEPMPIESVRHQEKIRELMDEVEELKQQLKDACNVFDVWAVHQGDDDRHSGYPHWFFTDEAEARAIADGRGWYGGNAPISNHKAIILEGKAFLLASEEAVDLDIGPEDEEELRTQALAKLNELDKRVLGLVE